jgi:hypothetical protein
LTAWKGGRYGNFPINIRGQKIILTAKGKVLRASKDMGTGLIACGDCGNKYYYKEQKVQHKKTGWGKYYYRYFHRQGFHTSVCNQMPKSFYIEDVSEIFKIFYFYLVFDNTNELIKESQANIKQQQRIAKEKISKMDINILKTDKQISKLAWAGIYLIYTVIICW